MDTKERPTKEFETPNGFKVKVKTYATPREFNEIQKCYTVGANVSVIGKIQKVEGFDIEADFKATEVMYNLLVVSIDDKTENLAKIILDEMSTEDADAIDEELNELSGKKKAMDAANQ